MLRVQKDVGTRYFEVLKAWRGMRPLKLFFGLTADQFEERAKPFTDARDELAELEAKVAHAVSKRDAAAILLLDLIQGVVAAVRGDPTETQNGELYSAMGYVPKNQRSTGLVRRGKSVPASPAGSG